MFLREQLEVGLHSLRISGVVVAVPSVEHRGLGHASDTMTLGHPQEPIPVPVRAFKARVEPSKLLMQRSSIDHGGGHDRRRPPQRFCVEVHREGVTGHDDPPILLAPQLDDFDVAIDQVRRAKGFEHELEVPWKQQIIVVHLRDELPSSQMQTRVARTNAPLVVRQRHQPQV